MFIKQQIFSLTTLILLLLASVSCQHEEVANPSKDGKLQISLNAATVDNGRVKANIKGILVSIKNSQGLLVHEHKLVTLFKLNDTYLSEPITLTTGNFSLTEFIVVNEDNEAVFICPIEGSPKASLVTHPLPIEFVIEKDKTTNIIPEVVSTTLPTEGLVAYYPFNGNANDQTANAMHGTVHGAQLTSDRKGTLNSAYLFGGDDYISVADNNLLDFNASDNYTISLWVWIDPVQNQEGGINDILWKWSGDSQGYPFAISFDNESSSPGTVNKIAALRYDGGGCGHISRNYSAEMTRSAFHHIVYSKNGASLTLYIDNVLAGTSTDIAACATGNTSAMTIGSRGNIVRFFRGVIDDIRIYNRNISESEINALYHE
jgi:hypothetical protein